jgi:hypothetical protein
MLRLQGGRVESLWDEVLPEKLRELPDDLAQIDGLVRDEALLAPIEAQWEREAETRGRSAKGHGRPTIAMRTYVRPIVLEHRSGWGDETLMRGVSDSLQLRRLCLIPIEEEVPDESTVGKLTRRPGAEVVAELSRLAIAKARRETRFRVRAVRIDSTDHGSPRLAVRPRCPSDPQGQAGQADRVRLRRAAGGGDAEHEAGRAWVRPAAGLGRRATRARTSCYRRPSPSSSVSALTTGGRPRRRLPDEGERPGARAARARAHLHRWARLPRSRRTQRRLARYRVGAEGRISHLKRRHGLRRSRLKGGAGERTWTGWAVFASNVETYGRYA